MYFQQLPHYISVVVVTISRLKSPGLLRKESSCDASDRLTAVATASVATHRSLCERRDSKFNIICHSIMKRRKILGRYIQFVESIDDHECIVFFGDISPAHSRPKSMFRGSIYIIQTYRTTGSVAISLDLHYNRSQTYN